MRNLWLPSMTGEFCKCFRTLHSKRNIAKLFLLSLWVKLWLKMSQHELWSARLWVKSEQDCKHFSDLAHFTTKQRYQCMSTCKHLLSNFPFIAAFERPETTFRITESHSILNRQVIKSSTDFAQWNPFVSGSTFKTRFRDV